MSYLLYFRLPNIKRFSECFLYNEEDVSGMRVLLEPELPLLSYVNL